MSIYYQTLQLLSETVIPSTLTTMEAFVAPYDPQIKLFKDLTKEQRAAIIVYMVDGAWDDVLEDIPVYPSSFDEVLKYDSLFVERYGSKRFGVVDIPIDAMKAALALTSGWIESGSGDVDTYYQENPELSSDYSSNEWPVILSDDYFPEELLQDGWHRFNVYIQRDLPMIPCIFYV